MYSNGSRYITHIGLDKINPRFHQVLNALAKKLPHDIMHTESSLDWTSGPLIDFAPRRN